MKIFGLYGSSRIDHTIVKVELKESIKAGEFDTEMHCRIIRVEKS